MKMIFQHFFGNFFENKEITSKRLYNFGKDALSRFQTQNDAQLYDDIIAFLTVPVNAFEDKISKVDTALGIQYGKTLTVDQLIRLFKKTMSDKEGVIADAMGGFDSPIYLEFYPNGVFEYSRANKREMPFLVNRVYAATTAHASLLSPELVLKLKAFKTSWNLERTDQQHQKGEVSEDREERDVIRVELEIALLRAMHTLGAMYPANSAHCVTFFDFNMLFPVSRLANDQLPPA